MLASTKHMSVECNKMLRGKFSDAHSPCVRRCLRSWKPGRASSVHFKHMGVSENRGTLFGGPYNKDLTFWGTILGSPSFGNSHIQTDLQQTQNPKPATLSRSRLQDVRMYFVFRV